MTNKDTEHLVEESAKKSSGNTHRYGVYVRYAVLSGLLTTVVTFLLLTALTYSVHWFLNAYELLRKTHF